MENKLSEVIKKAQAGDNSAIAALYEEYAKSAYYLALKMLANKEDAEDITQEVFIYVCEKIGDLKNPETFPAWLNRITTSKCNDFFRKKHVALNIEDEEIAQSDFFEESPLLLPDRTFDNAETAEIITKIIDGLPLTQRICIYYYYYQRMTVTQISESLNVKESAVKNRLAAAREKIKKAIEEIERKDGIKLYGATPLMLTPVLMKAMQNFKMPQSVLDGMFSNITANISNTAGTASTAASSTAGTASTVTTSTAGTASTAAGTAATASALGIKAIAAAIAGVLAIGGITTAILLSGNEESEPESLPAAIVETETESETDRNNGEENNNFAATTTPETTTAPATTTAPPLSVSPSGYEIMQFGRYNWLILERQGNRALIISEELLEARAYHDESVEITWEHSSIRQYLNSEFYNSFSESDRARIIETTVINDDNPEASGSPYNSQLPAPGGNDTTDRIFLLSIDEARNYFASDTERIARLNASDSGGHEWYLRSPGSIAYASPDRNVSYAALVTAVGFVMPSGNYTTNRLGIRPAMWITLD